VYVYTSFILRGFPWHSPDSLYGGGHRADRCTPLDVTRITQERSYRNRGSTADGQEAVLREKREGENTESDYRQSEDWGNTWAI
jgi:hypothetical protein